MEQEPPLLSSSSSFRHATTSFSTAPATTLPPDPNNRPTPTSGSDDDEDVEEHNWSNYLDQAFHKDKPFISLFEQAQAKARRSKTFTTKQATKEVKRGKKYDGVIMDPPAFGIGAKKERWKIETKFPELVKIASQLLTENGFLIINTYSPKLKEENIYNIVKEYFPAKKIVAPSLGKNIL